ncbi:hypothetical protein A0130_06685 [Leifsonia xyli]|nr:hypothetical protein A0130_06685 [Leifsonia xyli]
MSTRRSLLAALWPGAAAIVTGCVVAGLLLSASLRTEFPLFSEASAERGRDCTTIRSARHALEATLQARLPMPAPDVESARAIRSAVTAFDARTQDIATPAVESALNPVRGALDTLSDSIQAYAAAPAGASADSARGAVEDALGASRSRGRARSLASAPDVGTQLPTRAPTWSSPMESEVHAVKSASFTNSDSVDPGG